MSERKHAHLASATLASILTTKHTLFAFFSWQDPRGHRVGSPICCAQPGRRREDDGDGRVHRHHILAHDRVRS